MRVFVWHCVTVGDDTGRRIQREGSGAHEVRRGRRAVVQNGPRVSPWWSVKDRRRVQHKERSNLSFVPGMKH